MAVNGVTSELARRTQLTVVTNALNIAGILVNRPRVKPVVTGSVACSAPMR